MAESSTEQQQHQQQSSPVHGSGENQPGSEREGGFLCGVVEGFYGRPWTTEQRKDLFRKMKQWGMDSYIYAPKDDYKHRAYWRELYTVEEADHLTGLISAAHEQNINFYYALSPGLDITYSSSKEVATLKRKLDQVSQFGCKAFALLFDDIEPEMSKPDKEVFQSFAYAQVSVTNEIYNHLNCPRFLFCPTQYCSTRAVPTVKQSEYLNTLGSKLIGNIDILWTGEKVISKLLTVECIQEITEVLNRPPVIWDNLHANDYDQKRVFLGPYSGRSPEIIPLLRGVVTNPNCEFHANSIAIQTLAFWSKCSSDTKISSSVSSDIKLETENEDGICQEEAPAFLSQNVYHPRLALKNAIANWLPEFYQEKEAWGPISKPQPAVTMVMPIIPIIPSVNTCMTLTSTSTTTTTTANPLPMPEVNTTQLQLFADVCSTVTSAPESVPAPIMNSLVSATKVVTNESLPNPVAAAVTNLSIPPTIPISSIPGPIMSIKTTEQLDAEGDAVIENDLEKTTIPLLLDENEVKMVDASEEEIMTDEVGINQVKINVEPMECGSSLTSPKHVMKTHFDDVMMSETTSTCSGSMQVESSDTSLISNAEMAELRSAEKELTSADIMLLCDLFYLPFEHGSKALQLLAEFHWLKSNAHVLCKNRSRKPSLATTPTAAASTPTSVDSKGVADGAASHHLNNGTSGESSSTTKDGCNKSEVQEWIRRSETFENLCQTIFRVTRKIARCPNKELCYDLFSYVWDIAAVLSMLSAFVKWLAMGNFPANINSYTQGGYTWFSKGWKETFMSGDQEPWVFRGGLVADLQRLIPLDVGNDLFLYKLPETSAVNLYTMRPYVYTDEAVLQDICNQTANDGEPFNLGSDALKNVLTDRYLNPFLTMAPQFCVVVEGNNSEIVGYACAALDTKTFLRNMEQCWIPEMCLKYPLSTVENGTQPPSPPAESSSSITTAATANQLVRDSILYFHNFKADYPTAVLNTHPALLSTRILKAHLLEDETLGKRIITVLLATLRSNGSSHGVHVCIAQTDRFMYQFYNKLGFVELHREDGDAAVVYLGRNF